MDVGIDGDPSRYRLSGSLLGKLTGKSRGATYNGKLELFEDAAGTTLFVDKYVLLCDAAAACRSM